MVKKEDIVIGGALAGGAVLAVTMINTENMPEVPELVGGGLTRIQESINFVTERIQGGTSQIFERVDTLREIVNIPSNIAEAFGGIGETLGGILDFELPDLPTSEGIDDARNILFPVLHPATWLNELSSGLAELILFPFRAGETVGFGAASGAITIRDQIGGFVEAMTSAARTSDTANRIMESIPTPTIKAPSFTGIRNTFTVKAPVPTALIIRDGKLVHVQKKYVV